MRFPARRCGRFRLTKSLLALIGCSGPAEPTAALPSTLAIISPAIGTDTVGSADSVIIDVQVLDRGAARAGIVVEVGPRPGSPALLYFLGGPGGAQPQRTSTTDASGRVRLRAARGVIAASGQVVVQAPRLGVEASVPFTILPGKPSQLRVAPGDTAIFVGARYDVRAQLVDQHQNPVAGAITYTAADPGVAVSAGGHLQGIAFARASIAVASGSVHATVMVSVVPAATLAVAVLPFSARLVRTDGGQARTTIVQRREYYSEWGNAWASDGSRLFLFLGADEPRLYTLDSADRLVRLIQSRPLGRFETWPSPSRDGQWIYFTSAPLLSGAELWRVRPDGSDAELVAPPTGAAGWSQPTPSPDGTRLAFIRSDYSRLDSDLAVLSLATRQVTVLPVTGDRPRWSPTNDQIAFTTNAGELRVVNADGSNPRTLAPEVLFSGRPDWSPDGRWIVATGQPVHLIEVATGLVLPLPHVAGGDPAWKPTP